MNSVIMTAHYDVNSFLINSQKRLGTYALLNLLQDAAWKHAGDQGHGRDSELSKKTFWVLTRQKLVMEEWPAWGEQVTIKTWVRPVESAFAIRDYEVYCRDRKVGESTTSWLMLNSETRRPVKDGLYSLRFVGRVEGALTLNAPKIELREDLQTLAEFQVRNSDLDINAHVNNTRYAQWVLDSVPLESLSRYKLHEYEVNFLAETKSGDVITIQQAEPWGNWIYFQGLRKADTKIVFTARLHVSEPTTGLGIRP